MPPMPSDSDLRGLIHFSAEDGRIWLAGQRMVLLHTAALGSLRNELLESVGAAQTRRCFIRAGFAAGERDAALARQIRGAASLFEMFVVGPQLHMLEGAVRVQPMRFEVDHERGHFHGEFRWDHSWEAETFVRDHGIQEAPVCWMLLGYASGYTSAFMGRTILFKETSCVGCGHDHCHIVGKPLEDWPDAEEMASYFRAESMLSTLHALQSQVDSLRSSMEQKNAAELIGRSPAFQAAYDLLRTAAPTQVTVLLTGETGVGKERFARALHALSNRADKPFVAINCAALPHDLVESELFGAEKGAYTGSQTNRPGRFERAEGGTLFLDEIGELPMAAQAKLLRAIQEGEIERLGSTQIRSVNVRLVCATNQDLEQAVRDGRFRADLFYRINVYPVRVPPLRDRSEDIESLVRTMLARFADVHGKPLPRLTDYAYEAMRMYPWPGNVRELENLVERAVILAKPEQPVDAKDIFPGMQLPEGLAVDGEGNLSAAENCPADPRHILDRMSEQGVGLDALERALLKEAITRHRGNLAAAARVLGLTRAQLSYRIGRRQ